MLHVFTQKISFYISAYAETFFIIQLVAHVPNGFWTHNLIHHLFLWKNEVSFKPEFIGNLA